MWNIFIETWRTDIGQQPFFLLQALAVLGTLSVVLFGIDEREHLIKSQEPRYGLALGVTGFLLIFAVVPYIQGPARPYLRTDLAFLAGLFGGLPGGAICFALIATGRLAFSETPSGGTAYAIGDLADIAIGTLGGLLLRPWLMRKSLPQLNWKDAMLATLVEKTTAILALLLPMAVLRVTTPRMLLVGIYSRLLPFVSFLIVSGAFSLFRREAQARADGVGQSTRLRTDALTGLPNRIALREYLDLLFKSQPSAVEHTLVLVEVNNVADMILAYGHEWQNIIWSKVIPLIKLHHSGNLLSKFEPKYFLFSEVTMAIVLHNITPAKVQNLELIPNLRVQLQRGLSEGLDAPAVRLGFAVANAHGADGFNPGDIPNVAQALRNLSLALRASDLPVRFFDRSLVDSVRLDEHIRQLLVEWIENCTPPMMYQPKCHLATNQLSGAEALLRGQDANCTPLQPLHVLEVARRHQLSAAFEWCTIEAVVRDSEQMAQYGRPLVLSVNVSAASLAVPSFGLRVAELLARSGITGSLLCIEVTEVEALPDIEIVHNNFRDLRQAGVSIALDDFGAGYSALSVLGKFSFNELKIDSAMIARLGEPRMQAAVSLALETAKRYDARLVAEGVETKEQASTLNSMGIEYAQGFLFGRALPLKALLTWTPQLAKSAQA